MVAQYHCDATREADPHALPDTEVFYLSDAEARAMIGCDAPMDSDLSGWWWWFCFPGCLPDSDPCGPHGSEADALADARGSAGFCPHGYDFDDPCGVCDAE